MYVALAIFLLIIQQNIKFSWVTYDDQKCTCENSLNENLGPSNYVDYWI